MPLTKYRVAWWRRWLARPLIRGVFQLLLRTLARVKIEGVKNIPKHTAYIAVINHISLFEAPFMAAFWPEQMEVIGASDIWEKPGQNILARMWGGIPVHRGDFDRAALEGSLSALHAGYALLIAPEGGRSHKPGLRRAKPGVAYLAELSGVPIIPVGIVGTTDDFWQLASHWKHPPLEMHIGKPFQLPSVQGKGAERRESRQANADLVMRKLTELLPEEYRGVYG
jgi:1-acyl-sn-glycerol-3-phosphate acyltransferase